MARLAWRIGVAALFLTACLPAGGRAGISPSATPSPPSKPAVRSSPEPSPPPEPTIDVFTLTARRAREVSTLLRMIDAYNAGSLDQVLSLLDDQVVWSDCDYRRVAVVNLIGKSEVGPYLAQRVADHDRLEVKQILNHNPDEGTAAVGVSYVRRTSDTLRALGFPNGISPGSMTKVVFSGSHDRIRAFANGPFGGPVELCRPRA